MIKDYTVERIIILRQNWGSGINCVPSIIELEGKLLLGIVIG